MNSLSRLFVRPIAAHLVGATLFALVLGGAGYFVAMPLRSSRLAANAQADQIEALVQKNRQMFGQLDQLRQEFNKTEERAEAIRRRIPSNGEEAELLGQLSKLAESHRLAIVDYRRGSVTRGEQFSRLEVELQCEGSFRSICHFVNAVSSLERLTTVDQLDISTVEDVQRYPADMKIALYYRHNATDSAAALRMETLR